MPRTLPTGHIPSILPPDGDVPAVGFQFVLKNHQSCQPTQNADRARGMSFSLGGAQRRGRGGSASSPRREVDGSNAAEAPGDRVPESPSRQEGSVTGILSQGAATPRRRRRLLQAAFPRLQCREALKAGAGSFATFLGTQLGWFTGCRSDSLHPSLSSWDVWKELDLPFL